MDVSSVSAPRPAAAVPSRLMALLACPACRDVVSESSAGLRCGGCGREFPVTDGIPRLVADLSDAERIQQEAHEARDEAAAEGAAYDRYFEQPLFAAGYVRYLEPLIGAGAGCVLELGCGRGALSRRLAGGVQHLVGVDLSVEGLRAMSWPAQMDLVQGSILHLPFGDGQFDGVACQFVLHHLQQLGPVLAEVHRVLKPGGWFVAWEPAVRVTWLEVWLGICRVPVPLAQWLRRRYAGWQRRWALGDGFGGADPDRNARGERIHFFRSAGEYAEALRGCGFQEEVARTAVLEYLPPRYLERSSLPTVERLLTASDRLMNRLPSTRQQGKFILLRSHRCEDLS